MATIVTDVVGKSGPIYPCTIIAEVVLVFRRLRLTDRLSCGMLATWCLKLRGYRSGRIGVRLWLSVSGLRWVKVRLISFWRCRLRLVTLLLGALVRYYRPRGRLNIVSVLVRGLGRLAVVMG